MPELQQRTKQLSLAFAPLLLLASLWAVGQLDEKEQLFTFLTMYGIAFVAYLLVVRSRMALPQNWIWSLIAIAWLLPFFEMPYLSNDFYRFLWDGEMIHLGVNPFDYTPKEFLTVHPEKITCELLDLFAGMGELSQRNYSVYPAFNQALFYLGTAFSHQIEWQVFTLRIEFLLGVLVLAHYGQKCLKKMGFDRQRILILLVNPLVIIESMGNLHFELIMVTFVLIALYYVLTQNNLLSAIALALAVQIKLIPLLIFPFLLRLIGWKQTILYGLVLFSLVFGSSLLFIDSENLDHFLQSLNLYFRAFEFNSFLLYPYIQWGKLIYGWNRTRTYAPMLANWAFYTILAMAFYGGEFSKEKFFSRLFYGLCIYFLFTSTLHPWYWIFPLTLVLFKPNGTVVLMTGLTMLSYGIYTYGHHSTFNHVMSALNLGIVGLFIYEIFHPNRILSLLRLNQRV